MLGKVMLRTMFDYNHWANLLLLDKVASLTPEKLEAISKADQVRLHETLFHMVTAEHVWLYLCKNKVPNFPYYNEEAHASIDGLRAYADQTYQSACAYLESANESELTSTVFAMLPDDLEHDAVMWRILIHVLYHSAQHRSEVATLLTSHDLSPGNIDFFDFMFEP